jgi:manganese transport protein
VICALNDLDTRRGFLRSIGPAIIVASVVLGPGSILTSSRVGCQFGYELIWVVVLAAVMMVTMTALAARLGVLCDGTLCDEIAARAGRPFAALVGIVLFLVVACFQFSNNIAVVAAIEPYEASGTNWKYLALVILNASVLVVLFGFRRLYDPIEWMMKILVGVMLLGFLGNVAFAQPAIGKILGGFLPSLPESLVGDLMPRVSGGEVLDPMLPVQGLIATTFSVAGAFYAAYLVRQKGWGKRDLRDGLRDSVVGISVLALLTLMIMVTAAAVLHGRVEASSLTSAADVAMQLEPLFGRWAKLLFSIGLLAGALSSFLINVMIGGTVLSDGLGLGGDMDQKWPKRLTALALLIGLGVALLSLDAPPVRLIVFAQAMTVLGNPILAGVLLWLSTRFPTPRWIQVLAACGFLLVLVLAVRTGVNIYHKP